MNAHRFRPLLLAAAWLLSAALAIAGDLTQAMPYSQGTRKIVLEQLETLLANDKSLQIIGQGSWLRGPAAKGAKLSRNYADPLLGGTSDHDLRLVMQGDDGQVLAKWKSVRDQLAERIRGVFKGKSAAEIEKLLIQNYGYTVDQAAAIAKQGGDDVARLVLKSVNLYPPPQVMRNVVNDKTARALFTRAGAVPSLAGEMVEGVWGEGAPAMIQTFESQGRLFHNAGGKVRAGFTDLVHMAEGYGKHTMGGYANMAFQWAEKAAEAAHAGDAEAMAKYLSRLKDNLERARAKGNLTSGVMDDFLRQIDDLAKQAKLGSAVFENPRLAALLKEARLNSKLLGELARNPGPVDRQIVEAILGRSAGRFGKFGEAMREVWEKADNWTMFERGLQGAFMAWSVMSVSGTWGEKGAEDALRQANCDIMFFVGLVPGFMGLMTNMVIDSAKDAGYDLAVSGQEYQDFLAGISSVKGYQGFTGSEKSIEQIAFGLASPVEVQRLVETQAWNIAQLKETGAGKDSEATAQAREGIKQALMKRMTPIVLREWSRVRKERMVRVIDQELMLDDLFNQVIFRVPAPKVEIEEGKTEGSVELAVQSDADWPKIEAALQKIAADLQPLGGVKKDVQCDYRATLVWTQGNRRQELSSRHRIADVFTPQGFTFSEIGQQAVTAEFGLEIILFVAGGADVARDVMDAKPLLVRKYQRKIPVAVDVLRVARAKPKPPKSAVVSVPEKVGAGEVFTLRLDRAKLPDFKLGKYQVMLLQPGKKLTFEDAAVLEYDPSGSMNPEGVKQRVSVLADRSTPAAVEIDVQVRQVGEFAQAEAFDLALVKLDEKGSVTGELNQAMADLDKAQKEMDEAMAKMTPEQLAEMNRKMEEALAKLESGEAPPPPPADLLPPPPMYAIPIVIRPPQIDLKVPKGWTEPGGARSTIRQLQREQGNSASGNHVYVSARFTAKLVDAVEDRGNGDMVADLTMSARSRPGATVTPVKGIGGYAGEMVRRQVVPQSEDPWRYTLEGGAILRRGDVFLAIETYVTVEGFRRVVRDNQGNEKVLYDTRAQADQIWAEIGPQIDELFASLGASAKTAAAEPSVKKDAVRGPEGEVRLEPAKTVCAPGEIIEIACVVDFPKSEDQPYRYEWGGNHAGEGDKVLFVASDPGRYGITVMVRNSAGKLVGSTSVDLQVK